MYTRLTILLLALCLFSGCSGVRTGNAKPYTYVRNDERYYCVSVTYSHDVDAFGHPFAFRNDGFLDLKCGLTVEQANNLSHKLNEDLWNVPHEAGFYFDRTESGITPGVYGQPIVSQ